jgi:hypothetical protein
MRRSKNNDYPIAYGVGRKGADNDFDTSGYLGMPLKSASPDQPPGWNDEDMVTPSRMVSAPA